MRPVIIALSLAALAWAAAAIYRLTLSVDSEWSPEVRIDPSAYETHRSIP
jgi:hypothetical protein